nr:hypothetical protein [uncultured bacterium]
MIDFTETLQHQTVPQHHNSAQNHLLRTNVKHSVFNAVASLSTALHSLDYSNSLYPIR